MPQPQFVDATPAPDDAPPSAADQRLAQLIEAVRGVFATKGFDGASMQDLAQAAGMSAGNFYRYFRSKDEIIAAMVERDLAGMQAHFAAIMQSDDPAALLKQTIDSRLAAQDCDAGPLFAEINAAAGRRPAVGALMQRLQAEILGNMSAVFARIAGDDRPDAAVRFHDHAVMLFTLAQGLMMRRRPGDGYAASRLRELAHRLIDTLLDDIRAMSPDGVSPNAMPTDAMSPEIQPKDSDPS